MARQLSKKYREGSMIYRVVSDSVITAATVSTEKHRPSILKNSSTEVAKCECCGLGEECTVGYVKRVREQHCGHFVCGLCAEAVKEEHGRLASQCRDDCGSKLDQAIKVHMNICKQFNCAVREHPVAAATTAMRQLLVRRAGGGSPRIEKKAAHGFGISRSSSCIPALAASNVQF